jgi:hydrogenase maturation protease
VTGRVLVVGFGNDLVGDDGAGLAVARRLGTASGGLRAVEGHSDSLRLPALWDGEPDVWLVDALVRGAPGGTVHHLSHEELLAVPQRHGTVHQLSLPESLRWIGLAHPEMTGVRYRLWGIEPARLALEEGLTPEVAAAVEAVCAEIRAEVTREPCSASRRQASSETSCAEPPSA